MFEGYVAVKVSSSQIHCCQRHREGSTWWLTCFRTFDLIWSKSSLLWRLMVRRCLKLTKKEDGPLLGQQYLFKVGMSALFARVNNELFSRTFILKQLLAVTWFNFYVCWLRRRELVGEKCMQFSEDVGLLWWCDSDRPPTKIQPGYELFPLCLSGYTLAHCCAIFLCCLSGY